MNIPGRISPPPPPPGARGTETRLGAGTFRVTRTYAGRCPVGDLLRQHILQAADTASPIDGGIGTAV